jgi:WD40 repeat protein
VHLAVATSVSPSSVYPDGSAADALRQVALACARLGQLLVWDWRAETYVLKQQGHYYDVAAVAYSPDGALLASGADDSKVPSAVPGHMHIEAQNWVACLTLRFELCATKISSCSCHSFDCIPRSRCGRWRAASAS